jgi:hypothetical protein
MVRPPWSEEQQERVFNAMGTVQKMCDALAVWLRTLDGKALRRVRRAAMEVSALLDATRDSLWVDLTEEFDC